MDRASRSCQVKGRWGRGAGQERRKTTSTEQAPRPHEMQSLGIRWRKRRAGGPGRGYLRFGCHTLQPTRRVHDCKARGDCEGAGELCRGGVGGCVPPSVPNELCCGDTPLAAAWTRSAVRDRGAIPRPPLHIDRFRAATHSVASANRRPEHLGLSYPPPNFLSFYRRLFHPVQRGADRKGRIARPARPASWRLPRRSGTAGSLARTGAALWPDPDRARGGQGRRHTCSCL